MTRPKMTYEIALACAKDAAEASMRAAGRTSWSEDDYSVCVATLDRLFPDPLAPKVST